MESREATTLSFIRRGVVLAVIGVLAVTAALLVWRFFSAKFDRTTGRAAWIWSHQKVSSGEPVVFFAAKSFDLPAARGFVKLKIAADPEYTLMLNGVEIGGGRAHDRAAIDVYDVTPLVRDRANRIVVTVRSPKGVGGLLVAVDAGSMLENIVVSDESWRIYRRWNPGIPEGDVAGAMPAHVIGRPPMGKWNYPAERPRELAKANPRIIGPNRTWSYDTRIPVVRVVGGVAIGTSEPSRAQASDFGPVEGRARIETVPGPLRLVSVRLANHAYELEQPGEIFPLVVGEGESVVVDPEPRRFRIIVVHDSDANATVLRAQ